MRRTVVVLALIVGIAAPACGDDSTAITDIGVGDCFDDEGLDAEVIIAVPQVPCDEPHDNEVYFEFTMTNAFYPGLEAALDAAEQQCLREFDGFVGIDYFESDLDIFSIVPTEESWEAGDRTALCALYALDFSKLTGSMRGAAR
jgi:hypothetical protein